ncbi:MAG: GntR family transcriptional regulator [Eubacteriales bacterium]|nr:GntR family transcriptional regulator [Eubacteriales bacterium]
MSSIEKSKPLYIKIADILKQQIITGVLNPGDMLPSENSICETYGVSRDTARKGLQKLEHDNLIYSKPKIGYFVKSPKHNNFSVSLMEQLPGCSTRYRDIHGILPDDHIQEVLQIDASRKVIEFTLVSKDSSDIPVAYDIKYIPYERSYPSVETELQFAVFPDITFPRVAPYSYHIELSVSAIAATNKIADILLCDPGEPLLLVEQIFIGQNDTPICYAIRYLRQPYAVLNGTSGKTEAF